MKNKDRKNSVIILGSTGSVGRQAVDVALELGLKVRVLAAGRNYRLLAEQAEKLKPEALSVTDAETAELLRRECRGKYEIIYGSGSLESLLERASDRVIIHAVAGLAGLPSALAASRSGARVAMANKEAIIAAGDLIFSELEHSGGELIPVDSEHSAIFQCLDGGGREHPETVKKLLLTASGGPFFGRRASEIKNVTPEEALSHPTWEMGPKITVDSATLMNKGFEVIEAVRLFGVKPEQVEVLIHRQSIIHSMVEYIDNSVIAELARPDMRSCIRYAISYPTRFSSDEAELDFAALSSLTFERPDTESFPLLRTAYDAVREGGVMPAALIAADEAAVGAFLSGRISFGDISSIVIKTLDGIKNVNTDKAEEIREAVIMSKRRAEEIMMTYR